ncbi:MAG: hypothetical protein ACTHMV_19405 [Chitinophagaceae bacterium]
MGLHSFNTWLVANLIHPFLILIMDLIDPAFFYDMDFLAEPSLLSMIFFFSFILSLPGLLLAYACLRIIVPAPHSYQVKLVIWALAAPGIIAFGAMVAMIIFGDFNPGGLIVCMPAMLSAMLSVLIRYQQFKRLIVQHEIN